MKSRIKTTRLTRFTKINGINLTEKIHKDGLVNQSYVNYFDLVKFSDLFMGLMS